MDQEREKPARKSLRKTNRPQNARIERKAETIRLIQLSELMDDITLHLFNNAIFSEFKRVGRLPRGKVRLLREPRLFVVLLRGEGED